MYTSEEVKKLVSELLIKEGYELYSFRYNQGKSSGTLEIIIDRDNPISLDDIGEISQKISDLLDEYDFTNVPYTLDVSSLGIEKPVKLECLEKYINKYINIHLSNPYKGLNTLEGDLLEVTSESIILGIKDKTRLKKAEINRKDIDKARLAIKF